MSFHNQVTLLTVDVNDPDLEQTLLKRLPEATRSRLAAFTHPQRRRQTLWGRLIAFELACKHRLELIETPPFPPRLRDQQGRLTALCIAHTGEKIAVGAADDEDPLMGLDLETLRPVRSVAGMSEMAFGADIQWASRLYEKTGDLEPFFLLWGMKEAEIKLNRGTNRYKLSRQCNENGEERRPEVIDLDTGERLAVHNHAIGQERLTVLTRRKEPLYFTTTASELARRLLSSEGMHHGKSR